MFASVEEKRVEETARVTDAEVVRDYVASTDDLYLPMLPHAAAWHEVIDAVTRHAEREIHRTGSFDVTQRSAVFVCRP